MALISPKNFMAPFTNKVHLATIAFVVILFAAFRAMGGAFSVQHDDVSQRGGAARSPYTSGLTSRGNAVMPDEVTDDSTLPELDEIEGAVRSVPRQEATAKPSAPNDLDEIIRRLNAR